MKTFARLSRHLESSQSSGFLHSLLMLLSSLSWGHPVFILAWISLQTCGTEMLSMTKSSHFFRLAFKRARKHLPPIFIDLTAMTFLHTLSVHLEGGWWSQDCKCPQQRASVSRRTNLRFKSVPPQVGALTLHFGWGQERISEALLPTGLGWPSLGHLTAVCAHGLTSRADYTASHRAAARFSPPRELNHGESRQTFPCKRTWILHHSNRKEMPPHSHLGYPCRWDEPGTVLGAGHLMGLFSLSVLRLHSGFFILPEVREGGRRRLTFRVRFS